MTSRKWAACGIVVLLLLVPMARADDILPKTPEEWKYERIDFPLSFAPDITYAGFEELRFAPGMFNAKSETYFTYIFAMKLDGIHNVDAALLKDLLTKYYRGLCRAVWGEDEEKPDFSSITADVTTGETLGKVYHFKATIPMIDAFVTRKPVRLQLDIQTHVDTANNHTLIVAQVSPKLKDHNVWKVLRSFTFANESSAKPKLPTGDGK